MDKNNIVNKSIEEVDFNFLFSDEEIDLLIEDIREADLEELDIIKETIKLVQQIFILKERYMNKKSQKKEKYYNQILEQINQIAEKLGKVPEDIQE